MEQIKEKQKQLSSSIENEYLTISNSFLNLSKFFIDLSKEEATRNQFGFLPPLKAKESEVIVSINPNNNKPSIKQSQSEQNQPESDALKPRKRRRSNDPGLKIRPCRRRRLGDVQYNTRSKTYCKLKEFDIIVDGIRREGYKLQIQFNTINDEIGAYLDFPFVDKLKNYIQKELEKYNPAQERNRLYVIKWIKDIKDEIYGKYTPYPV